MASLVPRDTKVKCVGKLPRSSSGETELEESALMSDPCHTIDVSCFEEVAVTSKEG